MSEPIGYCGDAAVYCPFCAEERWPGITNNKRHEDSEGNEVTPEFKGDQADCPRFCDSCREFIGGALTTDGEKYTLENFAHPAQSGYSAEVRDYYDYLPWETTDHVWELEKENENAATPEAI